MCCSINTEDFSKALSTFDTLCLVSRIRGGPVPMDYKFTEMLLISGVLKIKFDSSGVVSFDLFYR